MPILFHGFRELEFPVVALRSRQAHQALKSLATHKTDRNDARGCENAPATLAYGHVVVGPGRTRLSDWVRKSLRNVM